MAVYQDKALERVVKGLRKYRGVAQKARENGAKESDTRMIVSSVISEVLGWDAFDNLTGEHRLKGNFADFILRKDDKHWIVIEVKSINTKLNDKHLFQAMSYASSRGVDWILLTNGADWQLHRVLFTKPTDTELVFEVGILDEVMKPKQKAELLYLLTPEAQRKDELAAHYERQRSLRPQNIAKLLLSESVLAKLRSEVKNESTYRVDLDELSDILVNCVIRPEVQGNHFNKQLQKIKKAAKIPRRAAAACKPEEAMPIEKPAQ